MIRLGFLALLAGLAGCGAEGPPEPVTPGITADDDGVGIGVELSGTASIGVAGGF